MKKILVVDDDADLREVYKTVLSGSYEIREASSREEGLVLAASYKPDLILLDVMMEYQSAGFDMARELKKNDKTRHMKVLMVSNIDKETNLNFKSVAKDPEWLPVDDFLEKPVDPAALLAKIKTLI